MCFCLCVSVMPSCSQSTATWQHGYTHIVSLNYDTTSPCFYLQTVSEVLASPEYAAFKTQTLRDLDDVVTDALEEEGGLDAALLAGSHDTSLWRRPSRPGVASTSSTTPYSAVSAVHSVDFGDDFSVHAFSGVLPMGTDLSAVCEDMGAGMPPEVRLRALEKVAKYVANPLLFCLR